MDEFIFFLPLGLVACLLFFFMWKLGTETEKSGRGWMCAVVVWSTPVAMAAFASIFHTSDGFKIASVGAVYALTITCVLLRVNANAG